MPAFTVVAEKRDQLADMVKATTSDDEIQISVKVLVSKAFLEIIREVLRNEHDLVIKSAEKPEHFKETLFGSTDIHLMRVSLS